MKKAIFFLLLAVLSFSACRKAKPDPEPVAPLSQGPEVFSVNVEGLQLRASPGPEGKVVQSLRQGEKLTDLGEVSDFTTPIKLRGVAFDEPWLKVETKEGNQGWVYGGALNFSGKGKTADILLKKRLATFFGTANAKSIGDYQEKFRAAASAKDLAEVYLASRKLCDKVNAKLETGVQINNTSELPDLFWLESALPGHVPQLVAEGTMYFMFADFGQWFQRAGETSGKEDDDFFALCLQFFPEDSVEYFYPAYFMQTWDYGGHSLLGRGIHRQLLSGLDRLHRANSPFGPEILRMKSDLVNDITGAELSYWEKEELIIRELEGILNARFALLDAADQAGLTTRLEQFRDTKKSGIATNQQSGE